MKCFFLLFMAFFLCVCDGYESIKFSDLDRFIGKEVEIRGFLYRSEDGEWVLARYPNLRTCCVGKGEEQLFVRSGDDAVLSPSPYVVTLRGKLLVENAEGKKVFVLGTLPRG